MGVADWEVAAENGKRELAERHRHVQELMKSMPVAPPSPDAAAEAKRREALEARRQDIAAERMRVLEGQVARLEEQVTNQHIATKVRLEDKQRLKHQAEEH